MEYDEYEEQYDKDLEYIISTFFKDPEDYENMILDCNLWQYRTSDGKILIAEEIEYDGIRNSYFTGPAFSLCGDDQGVYIQPYFNYDDDSEQSLTELFGSSLVGRVESPYNIKKIYINELLYDMAEKSGLFDEIDELEEQLKSESKEKTPHELFEEYYQNVHLRKKNKEL